SASNAVANAPFTAWARLTSGTAIPLTNLTHHCLPRDSRPALRRLAPSWGQRGVVPPHVVILRTCGPASRRGWARESIPPTRRHSRWFATPAPPTPLPSSASTPPVVPGGFGCG